MKEEQECSITYDFAIKQVRVYSTRPAIIRSMIKRLGDRPGIIAKGEFLTIPMEYCRNPSSITRIAKKTAEIDDDIEDETENEEE